MGRELVNGSVVNGGPKQAPIPFKACTAFPTVSFGVGTGSFSYVTGASAGREGSARVGLGGPETVSLAIARAQREALDQFFRDFPNRQAG